MLAALPLSIVGYSGGGGGPLLMLCCVQLFLSLRSFGFVGFIDDEALCA